MFPCGHQLAEAAALVELEEVLPEARVAVQQPRQGTGCRRLRLLSVQYVERQRQ